MELAALICCFFSISCVGCARCADDVPRNSGPSHHPTLAPPARPLIYSQPPPKTTHIVYPQPSSLQYGTFSQQRTETDRLVKAQELIRKAEEQERIRKIEERQRVQRAEEQKALAELRRRQELLEESRRGQHQPAAIENERNRRKAERTLEYQRQQALLEAERNKNWPPLKSQRQQVVTKSPKKQQSQRQKKPQPPSPRPSRPGRSSSAEAETGDDSHYQSLRTRARREGDIAASYMRESREARKVGNSMLCKQLSMKETHHKTERDRLNREACEWIFRVNNKKNKPNTVDLHGLFVEEAKEKAKEVLQSALARQEKQIRFIVGKGLHSPQEKAKIKPAIEELMKSFGRAINIDPKNAGSLVVSLQ